jgi:hypothetical protein
MAIFILLPMVGLLGQNHNLLVPLACFGRCHRLWYSGKSSNKVNWK